MAPPDERRAAERHRATVLAHLHKPDGTVHQAVVRDASVTGAFILTRTPLGVGEAIDLEIFLELGRDQGARTACHVVRSDKWEPGDLWHFAVALSFDEPLACAPDLAKIAEEQAKASE